MKLKIGLACLIFFIVVIGLSKSMPPFVSSDDDFGALWTGLSTSNKEIRGFFGKKTNDSTILASDEKPVYSLWRTTFRPLTMIFYVAVGKVVLWLNLKTLAAFEKIFFTGLILHAFTCALLFFALGADKLGFFGALYFAFSPSLSGAIGRLCTIPYTIVLLLLILSLASLMWAFSAKTVLICQGLNFLSAFFWFASLLMHEVGLFFPVWLALLVAQKKIYCIKDILIQIWPHISLGLLYLWLKTNAFGLSWPENPGFGFDLTDKFYNYLTLAVDVCGPGPKLIELLNNLFLEAKIVKILSLTFTSGLIFYLLNKMFFNKRIIFSTLGFATLSWTSTLLRHHARYLYWPLPFFIKTLCLATEGNQRKKLFLEGYFAIMATVGLIEQRLYIKSNSEKNLKNFNIFYTIAQNSSQNKPIGLYREKYNALPKIGAAQAIWLCQREQKKPYTSVFISKEGSSSACNKD